MCDTRCSTPGVGNGVADDMHNAVEGDHYEHPDHTPEDMLLPGLPRLLVTRVANEFENAVQEIDESESEEKVDNRINNRRLDLLQERNFGHQAK